MVMMHARLWAPVALAAFAWFPFRAAALPAVPDGGVAAIVEQLHGVQIEDGERVVVRVDGGGATLVSRGSAATEHGPPPVNNTKVETVYTVQTPPLSAQPETLVATFRTFGAQGVTLTVENGFDHPMTYDAAMIVRRGQDIRVARTTICPIPAKRVGIESWGREVTGIILSSPRRPPGDDMRCSGDTGLVAAPTPAEPNVCRGEMKDAPVSVELWVDPSTGDTMRALALWSLRDPAGGEIAPLMRLGFPMQKDRVAGRPTVAAVFAMVEMDPPPSAKSASIVLLADGVEASRRPWRLYADRFKPAADAPSGARSVTFAGLIPFPQTSEDGTPDPRLVSLFAAIGDGRVRTLEARVEGDDGSVLSHATYDLSSAEIRNEAVVTAAYRDADTKRLAPGHCPRPAGRSAGR